MKLCVTLLTDLLLHVLETKEQARQKFFGSLPESPSSHDSFSERQRKFYHLIYVLVELTAHIIHFGLKY
jgi:hypothetical protein